MTGTRPSKRTDESAIPRKTTSDEYMNQLMDATTRRENVYWGLLFMLHETFIVGPLIVKRQVKAGVRWRVDLLLGRLPTKDESCRLKDCANESVALLPNGRSYSDGTPACRRHFLAVRGAIYGIGVVVLGLFLVGMYAVIA